VLSLTLLAARAAKRRVAYQGFPRVGPAVRMSVAGSIILQKALESSLKFRHTAKAASGQKASV